MRLTEEQQSMRALGVLTDTPRNDRALSVYHIVSAFTLIALVWKFSTFTWMMGVYQAIPVRDQFFPELLQSDFTLVASYLAAVAMCVWGMVGTSRALLRFQSLTLLLSLGVLCIHQGSYNDVTFCTAFWTAVWCFWYVWRLEYDDLKPLLEKGASLALLIIALILFGGAVGKFTAGYWNGAVLYDIYFVDRDFWLFNLLRDQMTQEQLRSTAMWYSRAVLAGELIGTALILMLPRRAASIAAIVLLSAIGVLSNFLLFSVLFSLIGLATVGLMAERTASARPGDAAVYSPASA